jgi:isopentenyl-diphosphate Delta-isomerase
VINPQELLFIVDEENKPLDPVPRHIAHEKKLWHRTTGIWVINNNKQILTQKRSLKKDQKPGFWEAFFGGHVGPGEAYLDNAAEELHQELGIPVAKEKLIPFKIFKGGKIGHKEFLHVFAYVIDTDSIDFPFEEEEVDELKWVPLEEIRKILLIDQNPTWVHKSWDEETIEWLERLEREEKDKRG